MFSWIRISHEAQIQPWDYRTGGNRSAAQPASKALPAGRVKPTYTQCEHDFEVSWEDELLPWQPV